MARVRLPPNAVLAGVIVVVGALATVRASEFLTWDNIVELLRATSTYFIVACPLALLFIAGGLDFSVGATFSVGGVLATWLMVEGVPWPAALLAGVAAGGAAGLIGGALVAYLEVQPFVATLAVFFVALGLVETLSPGLITPLPSGFQDIGQYDLFGVPLLVWYAVVIGALSWVCLEKTQFGFDLRAIGGNRDAAYATGIRVRRIELTIYAACGATAAFAGILYAARTSAGQPDAGGLVLTLQVLTMVLVGGVSLSGGVGTIGGVALGALLIGELQNAVGVARLDPALANVFVGVVLAVAVTADGLRRRRRFLADAAPPAPSVSRLELKRLVATRGEVEAAQILAAVNSERRRIERDLHDGAQQSLVNAALMVGMASDRLRKSGDDAAADMLSSGLETLRGAMREMRDLARGIYPAALGEDGLAPAVEGLIERSAVPVEFQPGAIPRLDESTELTAYFVVAEALTNVLKYAQASHIRVDMSYGGEQLSIAVADDGVGTVDETNGSGLNGLRQRVAACRGSLDVVSRPGSGTTLSATFPAKARVPS